MSLIYVRCRCGHATIVEYNDVEQGTYTGCQAACGQMFLWEMDHRNALLPIGGDIEGSAEPPLRDHGGDA